MAQYLNILNLIMKIILDKEIIGQMILGSSIYSTGGGFEYSVQKKLFEKLIRGKKKLVLIDINELSNDDWICTAYGVGSAGNTDYDLSNAFNQGIKTLEKYINKNIKAVFAGETNIDVLAFQTASGINLPVLDADSNGGRAVPEIQFDNFTIFNKPIVPVVTITLEGEISLLLKTKNSAEIEKYVRSIASNSKSGVVAVIDHSIQVKEAKNILTTNIFKRSIKMGKLIHENKNNLNLEAKIIKETNGEKIINGTVTKIEIKDSKKNGFLEGFYYIKDTQNRIARVYIKNENILCWLDGKVVVSPPNPILAVNLKTFIGVHNSKIKIGDNILLIATKATKLWSSEKGKKLFNPQHFGF